MKSNVQTEFPPPIPAKTGWDQALRWLVNVLAYVAGISLMVMVVVTSLDVLLRVFRVSLTGAYDIVKIASAISVAAALPYTTAVKGHVAIEYFFHKLGRRGRVSVDTLMRLLDMGLFSLLAWQSVVYGLRLKQSGEVSLTLQLPVFWVPFLIAAACILTVLITFYHLLHPGKELIKP